MKPTTKITLAQFIARFYQMKERYIGITPWYKTAWLWFDYACSMIRDGASISDYFAYGFYKLRASGRDEFITFRRYKKIMQIANNPNDIEICRNKIRFNQYFADLLGRDWIDVNTAEDDTLNAFIEKHPIFFVKEIASFRGIGVRKMNRTDIKKDFFHKLRAEEGCQYILEEPIQEIEALKEFHPWSVNTIRVVTLFDTTTDTVHFMNARLRVGNKQNNVDNFHFDGIGANIDIQTGIINSVGYDVHNQTYIVHPLTGKQLLGFKLPHWNECLHYIETAAKRIPTVRYIGWDLVIKQDGTCCLIEANDNADHDFQQLHNRGLWKDYKAIIQHLK